MAYYSDIIDEYGNIGGLTSSDTPWDVNATPASDYTYTPSGEWRRYGSKIERLFNGQWTPFNSGVNSQTGLDALWASVSTPKAYYDLLGTQLGAAGMFDMTDPDASADRVALLRGLTVVAPNTYGLYGPEDTGTPGANSDALARAHFSPEQLMAMNSVALQDASGKTLSNFVPSRLFGNVMYGNDNANETWGAPAGIQQDLDAYGIRGELPGLGTGYYIDPANISGFRANEISRKYETPEDDGMFGLGGLGELALLAAAIYSGGTALGAFGGEAAAAGAAGTAGGTMSAIPGLTFSPIAGAAPETLGLSGLTSSLGLSGGAAAAGGALGASLGSSGGSGTSTGMFQNIPSITSGTTESLGSLFPSAGGTAYNPATASIADIVSAVSASGGNAIPAGMLTPELAAAAASGASLSSVSPSVLSSLTDMIKSATGLDVSPTQLLSGGANILGGLLSGRAGADSANTYANAQTEAARIAAEAARFKPVGVTTRFGSSKFTKDAQGNVIQAGYDVAPDVAAMRESLMGAAPGMLSQFTGSQAATAPMGVGAQRAMTLGNQYLATDPMAQAQKYYDDQQAVMATGRARDTAGALAGEFNRGTYGLATGATGMMGAANPRLEALANAQRQQDLQLAAASTQGGMDYAKFGAALTGTGGDLLKSMYGTQTAAYSPFQTAMSGATMLEGLGQNALDMSVNIGKTASPAQSGSLLAQGMLGAAQTQNAASYSPWGTALMGGANAIQGWQNQQNQQQQAQRQQGTSWYDPTQYRLTPI